MSRESANIFRYTDYREFLRAWLREKQKSPHFSLRGFSRRAGFRSHNILQMVVRGERGISPRSIPKYVKALGLDRDEADFFEQLVLLGTASGSKQLLTQVEARQKSPGSRRQFEQRQLALFRQWLAPIICEMTGLDSFQDDPAWISQRLGGRISPTEVAAILTQLEASGLLQKRDGRLDLSDKVLDTGDGVTSIDLFAYHETALTKAYDALWEVPPESRSFQVMTLALTQPAVTELWRAIETFESEVLRLTSLPGPKTEIYQVGVQAFPVLPDIRLRSRDTHGQENT